MSEIVDYDGVSITDGESEPEGAPEGATVVSPLMFEAVRSRADNDTADKAWVRYEGPRGGEGWQNPATREVRYQKDKPGPDAEGEQTQRTLPGAQFEIPNKYKPSEVWTNPGLVVLAIEDITGHDFPEADYYGAESRLFDVPTVEGMPDLEERQDVLFWFYEWAERYGDASDVAEFHSRLRTGETPYDDVTDEDVPDPEFNVNNYDEFKPIREVALEESDVIEGISSSSMYIAENENGDRLFVKNIDRDVKSPIGKDKALKAQNAARLFNHVFGYEANAPETHVVDDKYLAAEEYDGSPIRQTPSDVRRYSTMYAKHMAANLVVGNTDAHEFNVFTGWDGFYTVDLDHSFKHTNHVDYERTADVFFAQIDTAARTIDGHKGPEASTRFYLEATEEYVAAIERNAEAAAEFLQNGEVETDDGGVFSADELTSNQRVQLERVIEEAENGEARAAVYHAAKPWDRYVENVLGEKDPDFDPQPLLDEFEAGAEGRL